MIECLSNMHTVLSSGVCVCERGGGWECGNDWDQKYFTFLRLGFQIGGLGIFRLKFCHKGFLKSR